MEFNHWFLFGGLFLLIMVLGEQWLKKGPISPAIIYLILGFALGPRAFGIINFDILDHPKAMEIAAEIVVIISLFSAGLKLQAPFRHTHWHISAILASSTMVITVAFVSVVGHYLFELPWGAAILLGGIIAPTDPVLASEVQVQDEKDKDRIRRSLTGEAGMNDGTAFPVIMLGLSLLGLRWADHENPLLRWALVDFAWAIPAGLLIGYFCGWLAAKLIFSLHSDRTQKLVIEDFVSIGLICASYGLAQILSTYGFLAVFAAGLAFARAENAYYEKIHLKDPDVFAPALIRFSTQLERIGEVATVLFVGLIAGNLNYSGINLLLPIILIFAIRPIAVFLNTGKILPLKENAILSWFGIRGIGSIYYLAYAINHGFAKGPATTVFNLVMITIVVSVFVHGISATPIMKLYDRSTQPKKPATA